MPPSDHRVPFWTRPLVNVGVVGAGIVGLAIPLASHASAHPDHFAHADLQKQIVLPHLVLLAVGALVGLGFAVSERQLRRGPTRPEYIWWSGIFTLGVCVAVFGWVEKIIRRSGYDLNALDIFGGLWLLGLRVVLGSLAGWWIGGYLWSRRNLPVVAKH